MNTRKHLCKISTAVLVFSTLFSPLVLANVAGKLIFVAGEANVTHADNSVSVAKKDAELNVGDTIETKEGRVQLSLIDGGKVSLQPNTIYKINKYAFSGKEDGSEYAFTELVKGALRTISGVVGHKNRDRYQLKTAVATIGIRGTEFTVNLNDNNFLLTTNQGSVEVCGGANNCLIADAGMSIGVAGAGAKPKFSSKAATAASAPPSGGKAAFAAADVVSKKGLPQIVAANAPVVAPQPPTTPVVVTPPPVVVTPPGATPPSLLADFDGKGIASILMKTPCGCGIDDVLEANIKTDSQARAYDIYDNTNDIHPDVAYTSSVYSDGVISIGRVWDAANSNAGTVSTDNGVTYKNLTWLDYIVGEKPAPGQLNNLTGVYNVYASTAPIEIDANGLSSLVGAINSTTGNFTFSFITGAYSYNLVVNTSNEAYRLMGGAGAGTLDKNDPRFAAGGTITSTGSTCGTLTCSAAINNGANLVRGSFFGKKGERVGVNYGFASGSSYIGGSAVLK